MDNEKRMKDEEYTHNQPIASSWRRHPISLESPRTLHQAVAVDNHRVVVSGGINDQFQMLKTVELYDFWENSAMPLPDLSVVRYFHSSVVCDDQVFIIGGCSDYAHSAGEDKINKSLNSVEFFNMKEWTHDFNMNRCCKWKSVANMGTSRFDFATCITQDNNFIYALGGKSIGNHTSSVRGMQLLSSVERYDMINDKWEYVTSMRYPRAGHLSVTVGHEIFVFGGMTYSMNRNKQNFNAEDRVEVARTTEIFNIRSQSWTFGPPLPIEFSNLVAIVPYEKWIVLMGGQEPTSTDTSYLFFNTKTHEWYVNQQLNDLVTPRNEHAQTILDEKLLVFGGLNTKGKILKTIEFTNIQDFFLSGNHDRNFLIENSAVCEKSMDIIHDESCLNISVESSSKEIELSLLITELEDDFHQAFVQLGGDCSMSWMEDEGFQSKDDIQDQVKLRLDGILMRDPLEQSCGKESNGERMLVVDYKEEILQNGLRSICSEESVQRRCVKSASDQLIEGSKFVIKPEVIETQIIGDNNCENQSIKDSIIVNNKLDVDQKASLRLCKWIVIGFLMLGLLSRGKVFDSLVPCTVVFKPPFNQEKVKLSQSPIAISTASGNINLAAGDLMRFEIERSVHQCSWNQLESYFSNAELLHYNVEEDIHLLSGQDWKRKRKNNRALGDKYSFVLNCTDVRHMEIELVIVKHTGIATFSNTIQPVNSGDIMFSFRLSNQVPLQPNQNLLVASKIIGTNVIVGIKGGIIISIVDQSKKSFSTENDCSSRTLIETVDNEQEKIDISVRSLAGKQIGTRNMRFSIYTSGSLNKNSIKCNSLVSVKGLTQFYERIQKIGGDRFDLSKERTILLIQSFLSDLKKWKLFQSFLNRRAYNKLKQLQLYSVLRSQPIKSMLKGSPISILFRLYSAQSIFSVEEFCEALGTRRFDLVLTRNYLHPWRRKAKPKALKQVLKPICHCLERKHHAPDMDCLSLL